jgi:hypothetical protein
MRTAAKQLIVTLACWGWLPPRAAHWLLRVGRLSDA